MKKSFSKFFAGIAIATLCIAGTAHGGAIYIFNSNQPAITKGTSPTMTTQVDFFNAGGDLVGQDTLNQQPLQSDTLYVPEGADSAIVNAPSGVDSVYVDTLTGQAYPGINGAGTDVFFLNPVMKFPECENNKIQVTNSITSPMNLEATFMPYDGSVPLTISATLDPHETFVIEVPGETFDGIATFDGNGNPMAVSNEFTGNGDAAVGGFSKGATDISLPSLDNDPTGFQSQIFVQNTADDPSTVALQYFDSTGANLGSYQTSIGANAGTVLSLDSAPEGTTQGFLSSSEDSTVTVKSTNSDTGEAFAYQGVPTENGGMQVNMPVIFNGYIGATTQVIIHNTSESPATGGLMIYDPQGTLIVSTDNTIPAGGSVTIDLSTIEGLSTNFKGSAVMTANQNVVCLSKTVGPGSAVSTYEGSPAMKQKKIDSTQTIVFPSVSSGKTQQQVEEAYAQYASDNDDFDCFIQALVKQ